MGTSRVTVALLGAWLVGGVARAEEPRLTLVRPVRLLAAERYDPHYQELDVSGADRRSEAAFEAFAAGMVAAFGSRVVAPEGASQEARALPEGTLFVRAQISRADVNTVELATYALGRRRNLVLTTTGGLEVLDLVSGEVFESRLFTVYRVKEKIGELTDEDQAAIERMFRENVRDLFAELGMQLAEGYAPGQLTASVVDRLSLGRFVIDRGREAGLSEGESFRHGRSVYLVKELFDRFAVVESAGPEAPPLEPGTELSRIGFNTRRPAGLTRCMVLEASLASGPLIELGARAGVDGRQLVQWAHDGLRQEARLAMLPYGSIFREQESAVLRSGLRALEVEGRRVFPDVFVRLVVTRADVEWRPGGPISGTLVFNTRIDLFFVDARSGLVLGGLWRSGTRQEMEVAGERLVDRQATFRILVKETLIALCRDAKGSVPGAPRTWPIAERAEGGEVRLDAVRNAGLAVGSTLGVVRPIKRVIDRDGRDLGEYTERVGVVRMLAPGRASVVAERSDGPRRGDLAVGRAPAGSGESPVVGLRSGASEDGSGGDQAMWLVLSALVKSGQVVVLPECDGVVFRAKRAGFERGDFAVGEGSEGTMPGTSPGGWISISSRVRTENVTSRGFDVVGGVIATAGSLPEGSIRQGLRKTYTRPTGVEGRSIEEVVEGNWRWLGAVVVEETSASAAGRLVAFPARQGAR